jgi:hypothetical protein
LCDYGHRHGAASLIDNRRPQARTEQGGCGVDWKLELVVVPVSDIDGAKAFYMERAGFSDPDGNGWLVQEVRRTPAGDR